MADDNDSRLEGLQSQLHKQGADIAQMKEQITALMQMMGNLVNVVQSFAASMTSPPTAVEENGQGFAQTRDIATTLKEKISMPNGIKGKGKETNKRAQKTRGTDCSRPTQEVDYVGTCQKSHRKREARKDGRPIPDIGLSRSELFRKLWALKWICPKPGKTYTAPFPPWYRADLTCEYHMNAPGHSIDTCDVFRWHVLSLIDADILYQSLPTHEGEEQHDQ